MRTRRMLERLAKRNHRGVGVVVGEASDVSAAAFLAGARMPHSVMAEASGPLMSKTAAWNSGVWYMCSE